MANELTIRFLTGPLKDEEARLTLTGKEFCSVEILGNTIEHWTREDLELKLLTNEIEIV